MSVAYSERRSRGVSQKLQIEWGAAFLLETSKLSRSWTFQTFGCSSACVDNILTYLAAVLISKLLRSGSALKGQLCLKPLIMENILLFAHVLCQILFMLGILLCLCTGWLGGSRGPLYAGQALSKQRKREIREVFEKRREGIRDLTTKAVLNRLLDGMLYRSLIFLLLKLMNSILPVEAN